MIIGDNNIICVNIVSYTAKHWHVVSLYGLSIHAMKAFVLIIIIISVEGEKNFTTCHEWSLISFALYVYHLWFTGQSSLFHTFHISIMIVITSNSHDKLYIEPNARHIIIIIALKQIITFMYIASKFHHTPGIVGFLNVNFMWPETKRLG